MQERVAGDGHQGDRECCQALTECAAFVGGRSPRRKTMPPADGKDQSEHRSDQHQHIQARECRHPERHARQQCGHDASLQVPPREEQQAAHHGVLSRQFRQGLTPAPRLSEAGRDEAGRASRGREGGEATREQEERHHAEDGEDRAT